MRPVGSFGFGGGAEGGEDADVFDDVGGLFVEQFLLFFG